MCDNSHSFYLTMLNIFIKHYNDTNGTNVHMFQNIDNMDDTNEIMEEFMDHIAQFNQSSNDDKQLYNPTDIEVDDFEQLFGLKINDNIVCACILMIPLLIFVSHELDWVKTDWKIIPLSIH